MAAQPFVLDSYKYPVETFKTNIMGTVNVLESIRSVKSIKSVVIITTDKVYKISKKNKSYREQDRLEGFDPYSSSKVGTELIVDCYIKSFFNNSHLKNKISTVRAGNVIGGGDYSKNRLIPDILESMNKNKKLIVRNPNHTRPWQHVIDPLMGYLILAEKQYKNLENKKKEHCWNFGPNKENFKKVIYIIKCMKNYKKFNFTINKSKKLKETKILRLNSSKAKKRLKWRPVWNLKKTLIKVNEWNLHVCNGFSAKNICEKQFLMYLDGK